MATRFTHFFNIVVLIFLLSFNALALFGAGISEGGIEARMWFIVITSILIWAIFYYVQFRKKERAWRMTFAFMMVGFLFFWEIGFGMFVSQLFFGKFE